MPRASRRSIVLAVAGAALFLVGCGSGSGVSNPGVPQDFFGVVPAIPPDTRDLEEMSAAGVETVRFGLNWASVEPHPGSYDWAATDQTIGGLAAHGIEPLPLFAATPAWVAPEVTTPPLGGPRAERAWTEFLQAAVDRYRPDGTFWQPAPDGGPSPFHALCHCDADPIPITAWQVWNEPSLVHYFTPSPSVTRYAELLRISHDAIKNEDPRAQIVLAGLPGFPKEGALTAWQYLGKLFDQRGVEDDFDVVALHAYARDIDQLQLQVRKVRAVMRQNGDTSKPLWITELGWGSGPPDHSDLNAGLQGQKRLLTQSFRLLLRERTRWHLDRVYWFEWRDPPPSAPTACSFCSSAGLLRNDGDRKPAYGAFTQFTRAEGR